MANANLLTVIAATGRGKSNRQTQRLLQMITWHVLYSPGLKEEKNERKPQDETESGRAHR